MSEMAKLAQEVYGEFSDSDIALMALLFNSGARFRADILTQGVADRLTAASVDLIAHEMRRREVDPVRTGTRLMQRLLDTIQAFESRLPS